MDLLECTAQDIAAILGEDFQISSLSSKNDSPSPTLNPRSKSNVPSSSEASQSSIAEKPTKQLKPHFYSCTTQNVPNPSASSPITLSFGNSNLSQNPQQSHKHLLGKVNPGDLCFFSDVSLSQKSSHFHQHHSAKAGHGTGRTGVATKLPAESRDHIIAERKRRETLNQRIIALSALLPGLKKMDKASVLGEAIKYVKQLQERVKTLEEQNAKGGSVESSVCIKKSHSEKQIVGHSDEQLLEIEARVWNMNVLLRIHSEKQKGVLVKILTEIEKLNLTIINTSVVPFANSALDMTIITQMEKDFNMTGKDIVRSLGSALGEYNLNFGSKVWTNSKMITFGVN